MGKVKVAIPMFGSRVSPRCDCAPEILVVEIQDGEIRNREIMSTAGMNELQLFKELATREVEAIIGGAMPGFCCRMVEAQGIKIINVWGVGVDEVLDLIKSGRQLETIQSGHHRRGRRAGSGCRRSGNDSRSNNKL